MFKRLIKWMFPSYTAWIPLGNYVFSETDYIVFVRKNPETHMMQFKTRRVNGYSKTDGLTHKILPNNIIDVQKAWDQIKAL